VATRCGAAAVEQRRRGRAQGSGRLRRNRASRWGRSGAGLRDRSQISTISAKPECLRQAAAGRAAGPGGSIRAPAVPRPHRARRTHSHAVHRACGRCSRGAVSPQAALEWTSWDDGLCGGRPRRDLAVERARGGRDHAARKRGGRASWRWARHRSGSCACVPKRLLSLAPGSPTEWTKRSKLAGLPQRNVG